MTAQAPETLHYNGETLEMISLPLQKYLDNLRESPRLIMHSTGCSRGYYGTWEVRDNKLYLIGLEAYIGESVFDRKCVDIQHFFSEQTEVHAEWYSGELYINRGKLLNYIHRGFCSIYEETLVLRIRKGKLKDQRVIDNRNKNLIERDIGSRGPFYFGW